MVHKAMRALIHETYERKVKQILENTLKFLLEHEDTKLFGAYFKRSYSKGSLWAYCACTHLCINTNTYLESMLKILEHVYLKVKQSKRVIKF